LVGGIRHKIEIVGIKAQIVSLAAEVARVTEKILRNYDKASVIGARPGNFYSRPIYSPS
jgi:hypothetical protein